MSATHAGAAQQSVQSDLSSEVAGFVLQICMYSYVVWIPIRARALLITCKGENVKGGVMNERKGKGDSEKEGKKLWKDRKYERAALLLFE